MNASRRKRQKQKAAKAISHQKAPQGAQNNKLKNSGKVSSPLPAPESPLMRLSKSSPVPVARIRDDPSFYLQALLPKERLKCLGTSPRSFSTKLIWAFPGPLAQFSLVVPGYMTSPSGFLKRSIEDGTYRRGPRSNNNSDGVRFVVFQSFTLTLEEQVDAVKRLRSKANLVMVVRSGKKSIEAWFSTKGFGQQEILKLRRFAIFLGAPASVFFDCHPYALPFCDGYNGKKTNRVIYWNPSAI